MNTFLQDILEQPPVLNLVLEELTGKQHPEVERAAQEIRRASRVVITSMGSAYYSGMPMTYALSWLHPNVQLVETAELMRRPFFPDTLYIILSRSGESGEIAEYSTTLRERGEKLLAITMTPTSTLARNASLVIYDPSPYDGLICTKAYTTLSLTGLLIASALQGLLNDALISALHCAFAWMEDNKQRLVETLQGYNRLGESITFLSRGAGLGLAAAGSLWMEEGARVRAPLSSIDGFLHGPVEQVDERFLGVWIDLVPDARSERQYHQVSAKGALLIPVTPPASYAQGIMVPTFDLPEAYRVIPAALPVQLMAQRAAANRGIEAGQMRYIGWLIR